MQKLLGVPGFLSPHAIKYEFRSFLRYLSVDPFPRINPIYLKSTLSSSFLVNLDINRIETFAKFFQISYKDR